MTTNTPQQTVLEPMTFAEAIAGVRLIPLSKGKHAIIDWEDVPDVAKHKWSFNGRCAMRTRPRNKGAILMHRVILGEPDRLVVDHKNRNPLDNRRDNLRAATQRQNLWNAGIRSDNKSGIKGVHWEKRAGKWLASITVNGRNKFLGLFDRIDDAQNAYNDFAAELRGEFHCSASRS